MSAGVYFRQLTLKHCWQKNKNSYETSIKNLYGGVLILAFYKHDYCTSQCYG